MSIQGAISGALGSVGRVVGASKSIAAQEKLAQKQADKQESIVQTETAPSSTYISGKPQISVRFEEANQRAQERIEQKFIQKTKYHEYMEQWGKPRKRPKLRG